MTVLIYGAYGYTGELIANEAVRTGLPCVLAGRDRDRTEALASTLALPSRVFGLDDPAALDLGLEGVEVVLHCAGPFELTSAAMIDAAIRRGVHYLDITGELTVFEAAFARSAEATAAGVLLMPGVGLDVVPTDCLALHLKRRLPTATKLTLALCTNGTLSHGTATTMRRNLHRPGCVRRGGQLVSEPVGARIRDFDFGGRAGRRTCASVPWGDVSTAFHTTGIPDIDVFAAYPRALRIAMRALGLMGPVLATRPVQAVAQRLVEAFAKGAPKEARDRDAFWIYGEVTDAEGRTAAARMQTPEGYDFTASAAVEIARRVDNQRSARGFCTPAGLFGPDFALELPGVVREDL